MCIEIGSWGEDIVGRSLIRYSAVACVAAGGLFMGGTGAVAFADDETGGSATQTAPPTTASPPDRFQLPKWLRFPSFSGTEPRVGFIPPPVMKLPATLGSTTAPDGSTTLQAPTITLPFVIGTATKPAGRQSPGASIAPDEQNRKPAATTQQTPVIDLTRLVPTGPPMTIKNPLRELLPADLDLHQPLVRQLLPPPLIEILTAVVQHIPLAGLVISPVMEFVVPPFFADVVIPMLLSDIVVPTLPLDTIFPAPLPTSLPLTKAAPLALPGSGSLPPELAPMGMDVFQASASPAGPASEPTGVEKLQAPLPLPDTSADPLAEMDFRAGYSDYLRNAGQAQITAIAVPGAVAILLFTAGGGFIGYRQARAGHVIRAEGIARFLR